jgi:hypothetical protein
MAVFKAWCLIKQRPTILFVQTHGSTGIRGFKVDLLLPYCCRLHAQELYLKRKFVFIKSLESYVNCFTMATPFYSVLLQHCISTFANL